MSDEKPPMAEQPATVQLPAVPPWAIELTTSVKSGFAAVNGRLDTMETNQEIQGDTVRDLAKRMTSQEERVNAFDARASLNSIKVRSVSESDVAQEAKIADVMVWREKVETRFDTVDTKLGGLESSQAKQTEMITTVHSTVTGVINDPKVRAVAKVVWVLVMGYAAAKGLKVLP